VERPRLNTTPTTAIDRPAPPPVMMLADRPSAKGHNLVVRLTSNEMVRLPSGQFAHRSLPHTQATTLERVKVLRSAHATAVATSFRVILLYILHVALSP